MPDAEPYIVALKSVKIPSSYPWYTRFAHHSWFDLKRGGDDRWMRVEIANTDGLVSIGPIDAAAARADERWRNEVQVDQWIASADARRIGDAILEAARAYEHQGRYHAWPGPNSNTFVTRIGLEVSGLHFEQDHNAVGKDYAGLVRVGATTTGSGVELETVPIGVQIGFQEGVELHLFQLTFGISLFPPALKLPFVSRLGF